MQCLLWIRSRSGSRFYGKKNGRGYGAGEQTGSYGKINDPWQPVGGFQYGGKNEWRRQFRPDRIPFRGKGTSRQIFHPNAMGNALCKAHIQCDSIIMDEAQVCSIPEIDARNVDAQIVHEAAIGRINTEQLLKLRSFGMTEEEAEAVIIENFLR